MDTTVNDFWRMIWQERPKSIVMLCKFMEGGKKKCTEYFPVSLGQSQQYGKIIVQNGGKKSPESEKVPKKFKIF